jgi:hypothetical protein
MSKSRWHVPTQALGSALAAAGYALGHLHHGREFAEYNAHSLFAPILNLSLIAQVLMGVYLKLHLERGVHGRIRRVVRPVHSLLGKGMPVVAWTQMVLGGITALGFCHGDYLGQCLAHFIMGSAFVAYGILMTVLLVVGQLWLRRTNRSQEFFDSVVIAAWGCVNTFTEHRWGTAWVKNDWQHTAMGIFWWAAGLVGVWLSRDRDGHPQRNFIPAFVIFITGWGMSAHPQELMVSAEVHKMFGYTLMAGGVARLVEIVFVLKDKAGTSEDGRGISSWQYVPIFVSIAIISFEFWPRTNHAAHLRRRLPLHGRLARANGPGGRVCHGPRLLHPHPLLCVRAHVPARPRPHLDIRASGPSSTAEAGRARGGPGRRPRA